MRLFVLILILLTLCACTTSTVMSPDKPIASSPLSFSIELPSQNRLRFSGKGAGAGMMLMSSMGATGIAVGIAIDEGIGKDIEGSLRTEGFYFQADLLSALESALALNCHIPNDINVVVERYGFKIYGNADFSDPISVELKLKIDFSNLVSIAVDYPHKFEGEAHLIPLDEAKINGAITKDALRQALFLVMKNVRSRFLSTEFAKTQNC